MEKLFQITVICSMLITSRTVPKFQENTQNNHAIDSPEIVSLESLNFGEYMSDVKITQRDNNGLVTAFTYYSAEDRKEYSVNIFHDYSELYENNHLIGTATYTDENDVMIQYPAGRIANTQNYDVWSPWYFQRNEYFEISNIASITYSAVIGLVTGWLVKHEFMANVVSGTITTISEIMYNKKYTGAYAKIYLSLNSYCTILVKQKYHFYITSTNQYLRTEEKAPSWWGSPWDDTQPAACRALADIY